MAESNDIELLNDESALQHTKHCKHTARAGIGASYHGLGRQCR